MRAFKTSAAALALLAWFGLSAAVVVWCVAYLFWGEYRPVAMGADDAAERCVGTWCTEGSWMRTPGTIETDAGAEPITALGDYPADMTVDMLVGPLPGPALSSRFMAILPLILVLNSLLLSAAMNVAFWRERLEARADRRLFGGVTRRD